MFYISGDILYRTFNEINKVLFFSQLRVEEAVIMIDASLDTEFAYCYREIDNMIYLGVIDCFQKESHFRYVLMHEMIKLYQYQIQDVEPSYNTTFHSFQNSGLKKFKGTICDPHNDEDEDDSTLGV